MSRSVPRDWRPVWEVGAVLCVCALCYFWRLGPALGEGFAFTEGFRAQPAWAMLKGESSWLAPELFDRDYLRKPPGINWLMAGSAWLFGTTEWSARLVSALCATGMALLSWSFAQRWFGCGLWAGFACALTPIFWESGRAAEIEAANHFFAMLAALLVIDVLVFRPERTIDRALWLGLALLCMALMKGPAAAPLIGGAVVACAITGGVRVLRTPGLWIGLGVGLSATLIAGLIISAEAQRIAVDAVTQSPGEFLWERGKLLAILTLPIAALAQAAPGGIAWVFPWGGRAIGEAGWDEGARTRLRIARTLALAAVCAAGVYMVTGIANPRYAIPVALVGPVAMGFVERGWRGGFGRYRVAWARGLTLGGPAVVGSLLAIALVVYVNTVEASRRATSGRAFGALVGERLVELGISELHAHAVVEARPETLIEIERAGVDVRWAVRRPGLIKHLVDGGWVLTRSDGPDSEIEALGEAVRLDVELEGSVHEYVFTLVRRGE